MEQNQTFQEKKFGITPIQEQAATMLASGKSITEAAEALGISRGTIYAWQEKPNFLCYMNHAAAEIQGNIKNGIFALHTKAIQTIEATLDSKNELMRLKAAIYILEQIKGASIGETDAEKIIRDRCTSKLEDFQKEFGNSFDSKKYNEQMKENGLI